LNPQHVKTKGRLELWGGHECTVNRVGDHWFDQTVISGHEHRLGDLALFAGVGIRKLRYPALWERIAPEHPDRRDFRWTDERIAEIARLGMEPILTLCHHGSGPRYTSLLDPDFATGLAAHAAAVAARYPHVEDYTPVNEPLTTARFSAAYGLWYPHRHDERSFWLALLNEIDATRLAMRAIRAVNPDARLIQTDDLGFCHATPPVIREAAWQNERRWIGWDLLCGMVTPDHELWNRIARFALADRLRVIADDPCRPDIIGVNHYPSSERFLDHRLDLRADRDLADQAVGHCDGVPFVDVDAARTEPERLIGLAGLVEQAWERYRRPVAITECHHGHTRDEQARWLIAAWEHALALRARGVDVPAVTAWALLGSHDWNRMVTRFIGHYEPGVFDLRGPKPHPTLVASVLKSLTGERQPQGPGLDVPGWWTEERRRRLGRSVGFEVAPGPSPADAPRPLMIVSGDPVLTALATDACEARGLHYLVAGSLDASEAQAARPWAILAMPFAGKGTGELAAICDAVGARGAFIHGPEQALPPSGDMLLAVRADPAFTVDGDGLASYLLDAIDAGWEPEVDEDAPWSGVYGPTLIDGVLDMLLDGVAGPVSFLTGGRLTVHDLHQELGHLARRETRRVTDGAFVTHAATAPGSVPNRIPPVEIMLERFVSERRRVRRLSSNARNNECELQAAE
jgi:dTDP-4-dehydrorhamnose reductase